MNEITINNSNNVLENVNSLKDIIEFAIGDSNVRFGVWNGEPVAILKDLCLAAGIVNNRNVSARLNEADVHTVDIRSESANGVIQTRKVLVVNESGMYDVLFMSRKPNAVELRHKVTSEILPAIRKHGMYMTDNVMELAFTDPENFRVIVNRYCDERKARIAAEEREQRLKEENAIMLPKAEFHDRVVNGEETDIQIGDFAKLLTQNGYVIGRTRLYADMRKRGLLLGHLTPSGKKSYDWNRPAQKYVEQGIFKVIERTVKMGDSDRVAFTTLITGKGQKFLLDLYLDKMAVVTAF